jgi:hypothetical protein
MTVSYEGCSSIPPGSQCVPYSSLLQAKKTGKKGSFSSKKHNRTNLALFVSVASVVVLTEGKKTSGSQQKAKKKIIHPSSTHYLNLICIQEKKHNSCVKANWKEKTWKQQQSI